jgi:TonB family protein
VRIPAVFFACAVLLASLSIQAQTAPNAPASDKPCSEPPETAAAKEGILSDTQGVDFQPYLQRMRQITQSGWKPLMPKEVEAPVFKTGEVVICFKVLPSGRLMDGSMVLEGRSGDTALDRAAWGAIQTAVFPPLPAEFKGPYLEIRFCFMYNHDRMPTVSRKLPKPPNVLGPLGVTLGYGAKL